MTKPACVHVLMQKHVWHIHVWTLKFGQPDPFNPLKVFTVMHAIASGSEPEIVVGQGEADANKTKAKNKAELQRVKDEKEELVNKLSELNLKAKEMTAKVKCKNVYEEITSRRAATQKGTARRPLLSDERGVGGVWRNCRDRTPEYRG